MSYQTKQPCIKCAEFYLDRTFHHINRRGAGGGDQAWNLIPLCFKCHNFFHDHGEVKASQVSDSVRDWMVIHGWELLTFPKAKWVHNDD